MPKTDFYLLSRRVSVSYLLKCSLCSFATLCIRVFNLKANEKAVKYHISWSQALIFSICAAILWEEHNNSEALLISLVFVPVALLCGVLLIDDSDRHQFACGDRRGLQITFREERKNKEDEETITGEIIGAAGDESPQRTEGRSEARLFSRRSNGERVRVFLLAPTEN